MRIHASESVSAVHSLCKLQKGSENEHDFIGIAFGCDNEHDRGGIGDECRNVRGDGGDAAQKLVMERSSSVHDAGECWENLLRAVRHEV
jgi:hypothetical protein